MRIKSKDLIKDFYESIKEDYPDLTLKQVRDACHAPWKYTRKNMASGELPSIRLKYFGIFQVYEGRAKEMLRIIKERKDKEIISKERYEELKQMITKYLKRIS